MILKYDFDGLGVKKNGVKEDNYLVIFESSSVN